MLSKPAVCTCAVPVVFKKKKPESCQVLMLPVVAHSSPRTIMFSSNLKQRNDKNLNVKLQWKQEQKVYCQCCTVICNNKNTYSIKCLAATAVNWCQDTTSISRASGIGVYFSKKKEQTKIVKDKEEDRNISRRFLSYYYKTKQ